MADRTPIVLETAASSRMVPPADARPVRAAIDARVPDAVWGGVQQVVIGLASGLGRIQSDDEFLFLGYEGESSWLKPHLAGPCRLVEVPRMLGTTRRRRAYERVAQVAPRVAGLVERGAMRLGGVSAPIPKSDGTLESLGLDLVHFTTQQAFVTGAMVDAIARIWTDEPLRSSLRERGRIRVSKLSWDRTARTFRALYRKVAGRPLTDEDRVLLAPPTLIG